MLKSGETIKIESFIRNGGHAIPIKDFQGSLQDTDYIEGSIRLSVFGKDMLTAEMWDYVDQLWAYLIEGADRVKHGEAFSTFFPDQPIQLSFTPMNAGSQVHIRVTIATTTEATVPMQSFLAAIADGADRFFNELRRVAPGIMHCYERYRNLARGLV